MKRHYCFAILAIFCIQGYVHAQVEVDNSITVADLVRDVLIGQGVEVSNIQVNGMDAEQAHVQVGSFGDETSSVGLLNGLIMGTGNVTMAEQENTGTGSSLPSAGDDHSFPPLEALTSFSVNDQCVVEFDFIPQGDSLAFNYVFASEEYPEYVCGTVNDVFGFFLSGNNPDGGLYNNINLALIPDPDTPEEYTDTPVSINTLNTGVVGNNGTLENCEDADPEWESYSVFYQSNTTNTYEYDGRTVVLTARALVNCGETYHITMAIGDGGDTAFDSAVFLEAGSFSSNPAGFSATSLFPLGLVEISDDCDSAYARISRLCATDTAYFALNYLENDSTATFGVDYEPLPDTLIFIPNQLDTSFGIITIPDGIEEETEYICMELREAVHPDSLWSVVDTVCLPIVDNYTFDVAIFDQVLWCPEHVPVFDANPEFPAVAPFEYAYYLNGQLVADTNNYIPAIPNQWDTVTYQVGIVDYCGAINNPTEVFVANMVADDPEVSIETTGQYCPGIGYELRANRTGGSGPHTYNWSDELGNTYENAANIFVDPMTSLGSGEQMAFHLLFEDGCTPARTAEDDVIVTYPTPLVVEASMNNMVCTDQVLNIDASSSGGYPPYTHTWTSEPGLVPPPNYDPDGFIYPELTGDGTAFGFYANEEGPLEFHLELQLDDWCSIALRNQGVINNLHQAAIDVDTVMAVNCVFPNVVTPNDDGANDALVVNELINRPGTLLVFNRWGNLLSESRRHQWTVGDEPEGTYYYVVQFDDGESHKTFFTIVR